MKLGTSLPCSPPQFDINIVMSSLYILINIVILGKSFLGQTRILAFSGPSEVNREVSDSWSPTAKQRFLFHGYASFLQGTVLDIFRKCIGNFHWGTYPAELINFAFSICFAQSVSADHKTFLDHRRKRYNRFK